ncbi:rhomboid family intramembrane serine protease [Streptomyces sp. NPDC005017]|uniref:rhomboid family intramembrane serine protease n=1 Tax=Streptomyces sp. NPDC005017 TaxID=3364706 RepID=UPI0036CBAAC4
MEQQVPDAQPVPVCYRHPDRETGVRCTRCERPICPECMISASVGFQCPDCVRGTGGSGPASRATAPRTIAGATMVGDTRLVTKILIGINLAVFIAVQVSDELLARLVLIGSWPPAPWMPTEGVAEGEWYRLLTSAFTHQEFWHIGFNLLNLWLLGSQVEATLGRARYLTLYLVSGLAGSTVAYLLESPTTATLGASGAVFGLFGAYGVLMRRQNYDLRPMVLLLAISMIFAFSPGSNVSWQAHLGGLVAGVVITYAMVHAPRERRALVQYGTCGLVLGVIVLATLLRTLQLT